MTRERFEQLVAEAIALIPPQLHDAMHNVAVVVEDEPAPAMLADLGIEPPGTLYGVYEGTPLTEREWGQAPVLPDRITIFQQPIVTDATDAAADEDERGIVRAVGETVIHEFGHHFGLSEAEIEAIEAEYWQDGPEGDVEAEGG